MKAIKYLLAGAMILSVSTTAVAQNAEEKSAIEAVAQIISSKPENIEKAIKPYFKKNKKNPLVLTGFANAFLEAGDLDNAIVYADKAIAVDPQYTAAWMLKGDIYVRRDDGGSAAQQYEQAIFSDPKNPEPYYKYALIYRSKSPSTAIAKLNELKAQRPDIEVDAYIGHMYYLSNSMTKAYKHYCNVKNVDNIELSYLREYSNCCYLNQKFDKGVELALHGLKADPEDAGFNRLAFYNYAELQQNDLAIKYADKLLKETKDVQILNTDYYIYGHILTQMKKYEEAIQKYNEAIAVGYDDKESEADVYKAISNAYNNLNNFDKAIEFYDKFMQTKPQSKLYPSDYNGLAKIYIAEADASTDVARQKDLYNKAFGIYNNLTSKNNDSNIRLFGLFQQARIMSKLDPETTEGLAKPYYDGVIEILEPNTSLDDSDKAKLVEAYRYCGYYFFNKKDYATSKTLFQKVLSIDPTNEQAKQALEGVAGMMK